MCNRTLLNFWVAYFGQDLFNPLICPTPIVPGSTKPDLRILGPQLVRLWFQRMLKKVLVQRLILTRGAQNQGMWHSWWTNTILNRSSLEGLQLLPYTLSIQPPGMDLEGMLWKVRTSSCFWLLDFPKIKYISNVWSAGWWRNIWQFVFWGVPSSELHQVSHTAREFPCTEYVIAHGPSKFVTPESVDKLRRQKREGRVTHRDYWSYMPGI